MKRLLIAVIAALAAPCAFAGFDFRTTGTTTMQVVNVRCSSSVPPVSEANWAKWWVPCAGVAGYSAGNIYVSQNAGPHTLLSSFVGSGAVTSVFGRTGAVSANSGDYSVTQVTGAAPLLSPALTGTPTAPTPATSANSTLIATTAYVKAQGYGSGTVTSIAVTMPAEFSVSGSPITTSGTVAVTRATQTANTVMAGPASGGAAAPAFRALVSADMPASVPLKTAANTFTGGDQTISAGSIVVSGGLLEAGRSVKAGYYSSFTPTRSASSGTWTGGSVASARYSVVGKKLHVIYEITSTSVSATPASISITIPGGFIASTVTRRVMDIRDSSSYSRGSAYVAAGGTTIDFYTGPMATGTWTTSTATTDISVNVEFEVQ